MRRISTNDRDGYNFLRNEFVHNGEMPSLRTIAAFMGYKSPRSSQLLLERLRTQGLIYYAGGKISLVHNPAASTGEHTIDVPIVGNVSCGALTLADQTVEGYVQVSTKLASSGHRHFILRAIGDSMNLSGISHNDMVLVRQQPAADEGQKVVALVNDEATIKHFYRENGFVVLRPNSTDKSIKPIILSDEFVIQGVVLTTLPDPF